jgi:hypothetical protein
MSIQYKSWILLYRNSTINVHHVNDDEFDSFIDGNSVLLGDIVK